VWVGATSAAPSSVATATAVAVEIVANATMLAIGQQGYLARTRGFILATPASANSDPVVNWGIGIFDTGLTTAAAFPSPVTDSRDPYFAWGALYAGGAVPFDALTGNHMRVDSKGRRRFENTERVMLVLEGQGSGHTALVFFDFDVLLIPDQGA